MSFITVKRLLILLDNPSVRKKLLKTKRVGMHRVNRCREIYREYRHLYTDLRKSPTRFFKYVLTDDG